MKRFKKVFKFTKVVIEDLKGKLILAYEIEGTTTETKVALSYIKKYGYTKNINIKITEFSKTYVMSNDEFMKLADQVPD